MCCYARIGKKREDLLFTHTYVPSLKVERELSNQGDSRGKPPLHKCNIARCVGVPCTYSLAVLSPNSCIPGPEKRVAYAKMVKRPNFGCPLISAFLGSGGAVHAMCMPKLHKRV